MEDKKYRELRKRYPDYVSKDQLYRICHVSKRSAKYLLDNGIIPCEDTGKKTRRYRVALKDIIAYLKKRDVFGNTMIPYGAAGGKPQRKGPKTSYAQAIVLGREDKVRRYFEYIFAEFPDVLTMYDAAEMTGLAINTIQRFVKNGLIRSMRVDRQPMIPKVYMLDFVTGAKFLGIKSNSRDFQRVLGGFSVWKTQKS
jgi:hypothetical protein